MNLSISKYIKMLIWYVCFAFLLPQLLSIILSFCSEHNNVSRTPDRRISASMGIKPPVPSVLLPCSGFPLLFPPPPYLCLLSFPPAGVSLLISLLNLFHSWVSDMSTWLRKGERTWHPLQRICRISALTKQSIHSHITFHLPQGVSSDCVLNRCACSDQFCLLDDCWVCGALQMVQDNLTGYHMCYSVSPW